jgi:Tfp pilus assembly protein PilP
VKQEQLYLKKVRRQNEVEARKLQQIRKFEMQYQNQLSMARQQTAQQKRMLSLSKKKDEDISMEQKIIKQQDRKQQRLERKELELLGRVKEAYAKQ